MATLKRPLPVKMFFGLLSNDSNLFLSFENALADRFGPVDQKSDVFAWDHSDYYCEEMGTGLLKRFLCLKQLDDPGSLPSIKREMVQLEQNWSVQRQEMPCRRINIDPGYVTEAKVVLSTTKDFSHRIYIGRNIYAEVELKYRKDLSGFAPLGHTYPDFKKEETIDWFNMVRNCLRMELLSNKGLYVNR